MHVVALLSGTGAWLYRGWGHRARVGTAGPACAGGSPRDGGGHPGGGCRGQMPLQRLISKITKVPAPLRPSHAWGTPSAQHDTGMLFSIPRQHLLLPNQPWMRPWDWGIPLLVGEGA